MSSTRAGRIKSWIKKFAKPSHAPDGASRSETVAAAPDLVNPVENYYRHKIKTNLPVFYRFALQTRSLLIRDVLAKAASTRGYNLADLLSVLNAQAPVSVDDASKADIAKVFDSQVLLTLANLLANTARNDLDTHNALQIYDFVYEIHGSTVFQDSDKLQYVEALGVANRHTDLRHLAQDFEINSLAPLQEQLLEIQRIRQVSSSDDDWLNALNRLYGSLGMTKVRLSDETSLPLMDRLMAVSAEKLQGPKISVIMPTFSPGSGIRTAVRSLLEQTWANLEIIVVDDASPGEFSAIYAEVEQMDPRIQVVRHENNAGAYVARNTGLSFATGEFVTTHDDDDWSHPDKIATQIQVLLENVGVAATTSAHIRTRETMDFERVNIHAKYMQMNYSSLMFRRSLIEEIGPWDSVNRGGDIEFFTRLGEFVGTKGLVHLLDRPLSFSRVWQGSLTSGEMSRGFFANSRLLYRWAFRQWQWEQRRHGKKAIRDLQEPRPYAIPTTFENGSQSEDLGHFHVIYVTDFFRQAKYVDFVVQEIEALSEQGFRIGYMHMESPETNRRAGISPRLFSLQLAGGVSQVSYEDVADTNLLIVYGPSIGMFLDETKSLLTSRRAILIDRDLPVLRHAPKRSAVLISQALRHLDDCFNTKFEVVGASNNDQARLRPQVSDQRLLHDSMIWRTSFIQEPGEIIVPGLIPTVGFHSYGNQYRWPNDLNQFTSAYVSSAFKTRFFGHLESARNKFGKNIFEHSEILSTAESDESDFLRSIDFWVYQPHSKLADQIWEPVLSAMLAGKVVILPKRLEFIYGSTAVYADPEEISKVVSELSSNPERYVAQARIGRDFVAESFTVEDLTKRVNELISTCRMG